MAEEWLKKTPIPITFFKYLKSKKVIIFAILIILFYCLFFYQKQDLLKIPAPQQKIVIVNSILPLWQITNFLTSHKIENILLIKPTDSEHNFQLKNQDMINLQKAHLIFYLSKNLENLLPKLQQNPVLHNKIKEISQEVNFKLLPNNWHLWLNPHNLILIADWQTKQLCYIDSNNCKFYQENLQKFELQITQEVDKINSLFLQHYSNKSIVLLHDAYNYFFDYFKISNTIVLSHHHQSNMQIKQLQNLVNQQKNISCIMAENNHFSAQKLANNYNLKYQNLNLFFTNQDQNPLSYGLKQMAQQIAICL